MSKFFIGADKWPGITKLVEESGEVLQVCGKLIATDGDVNHYDGSNLKERLENELADLMAAIGFVGAHCGLNVQRISDRAETKRTLFEHWHETNVRTT